MPTYARPEDNRAYNKLRAERRRKAGLCANCNNQAEPGKSRCEPCAAKRRKPK